MHADRHTSRWVYTMFWTFTGGLPSTDEESAKEAQLETVKEKGHIMLFIQNRECLQIKKKNLTYPELKQLVEKLEG